MGHYCWICGRRRPNERFSGHRHARHICRECANEQKRARRDRNEEAVREQAAIDGFYDLLSDVTELRAHDWEFTKRLFRSSFGRATPLGAVNLVKKAVREIQTVARRMPLAATDGVVLLCERLRSACEQVEKPKNAFKDYATQAVERLVPLIVDSPADERIRRVWLDRLAVVTQDDRFGFFRAVRRQWAGICRYPDLMDEWATRTVPGTVRDYLESDGFDADRGSDPCALCEDGDCDSCELCEDDEDYGPPDTPTDDDTSGEMHYLLVGMFPEEDMVDVEQDASGTSEYDHAESPFQVWDLMLPEDPFGQCDTDERCFGS